MSACQMYLLFDEIEIVEQPDFRRDDSLSRRGSGGHHVVCRQQHTRIVRQPWQQPVRPRVLIDSMLTGQRDCVALQLLDAEQLRA